MKIQNPTKVLQLWQKAKAVYEKGKKPVPPTDKGEKGKTRIKTSLIELRNAFRGEQDDDRAVMRFEQKRTAAVRNLKTYCRFLKDLKDPDQNRHRRFFKTVKQLTVVVQKLPFGVPDVEGEDADLAELDEVDTADLDRALERFEIADEDEEEAAELPEPPPVQAPQPPPNAPASPPKGRDARFEAISSRIRAIAPAFRKASETPGPFQAHLNRLWKASQRLVMNGDLERVALLVTQIEKYVALCGGIAAGKPEALAEKKRVEKQQRRHGRLKEKLAAVKQSYLPKGMAEQFGKEGLDPGKEFKAFLDSLRAFEKDRSGGNLDALEQAALAYRARLSERWGTGEPDTPAGKRKKQICLTTLAQVRHWRLANELDALGEPPWATREEMRAAELYSKLLFEEGNQPAHPNQAGGLSGSWWVETVAWGDRPGAERQQKKFLFKPVETEAEIPGYPRGGSACREVLGKALSDRLEVLTGLELRTPETHLVAIANDKLPDPTGMLEDAPAAAERVGSMQHFSKSDGELKDRLDKDPTYLSKIPAAECQKAAVLDLIGLNTDRHRGNFLVAEEDDGNGGKVARLLPIDHGLVLPSRQGLYARRDKLGFPHSIVSRMPGADQPFTPELLAAIAKLDEQAIVDGMKDSLLALVRAHPEAAAASEIREENFDLVRRSVQFLKKAAAAGLTATEIYDAYVADTEKIFDSSEAEKGARFDEALKAALARTVRRTEFEALYEDRAGFATVRKTLQELGWCWQGHTSEFEGWACRNQDLVLSVWKGKRENPVIRRDLDRMVQDMGGAAEVPVDVAGLPLIKAYREVKRLHEQWERGQLDARARAQGGGGSLEAALKKRLETLLPYVNRAKDGTSYAHRVTVLVAEIVQHMRALDMAAANARVVRLTMLLDRAIEEYNQVHKEPSQLPSFSKFREELSPQVARQLRAYEDMDGDNVLRGLGQDPAQMTLAQKLEALQKASLAGWAKDDNLKKFRQALPEEKLGDAADQCVKFQQWQEYQKLGGTEAFARLGGSGEISALEQRLDYLRTARADEASYREVAAAV